MITSGTLLSNHTSSWLDLWERGRIDVSGDLQLSKAIYGSLYYLTSSIPLVNDANSPYIGLSPGGLPFGAKGEVQYYGIFKLNI